MTKDIYRLEILLGLLAILVSGISIFAIFSAPSYKFVKLIKWSDVESIELVFENTTKRLYPLLSEANHIRIEDYQSVSSLALISAIINRVTGLHSSVIQKPELIFLDSSKKNDIQLKVIFKKTQLKAINLKEVFDEKSFKKILKNLDRGKEVKKYIFCLYQVKSNQFELNIIENI